MILSEVFSLMRPRFCSLPSVPNQLPLAGAEAAGLL